MNGLANPSPSLSARRAWIEMAATVRQQPRGTVALRKESVDRNNGLWDNLFGSRSVALRKESVDRNIIHAPGIARLDRSLSARRAWIEIIIKLEETKMA